MSDATAARPSAFAGFDTSIYPGDPNMSAWKASSPYVFGAYYIKSPCHGSGSWMGRRASLTAQGWNLVPVYVGQQAAGASPCKSSILTAGQGQNDALDAGAKLTSEGFPSGTYVFLDIERVDVFSSALGEYITAWISQLATGDYSPGIYCHKHNAMDVQTAVTAGGPPVPPRYWMTGGVASAFNIGTSHPPDVGIGFANLWQSPQSVTRKFGGVTINIDENVAQSADPAAPAVLTAP